MFEQAYDRVQQLLWKEDRCSSQLDYAEQTSWMLFLKYLDDYGAEQRIQAQLLGKPYTDPIGEPYRWSSWAAPKKPDGSIDYDNAITGDDLITFVDERLFPYLSEFKQKAESIHTIEHKIGAIFDEITNKVTNGYFLRNMLEDIDSLKFQSQEEKYELSELYEKKLQKMGNAGQNAGEYYTPRPLIRAITKAVNPRLGETVYDGAVGSAGFLCEAYCHMVSQRPNTEQMEWLQSSALFGKEKKSLPYILGVMNMILHGIETPNLIHINTLLKNIDDIQAKDRFDVILANPPFGGKEHKQVQQNFPFPSGETAFLFLQHFIASLKPGGRAGMVIKNTFLSNADAKSLRKELLDNTDLHTVLICPQGTFSGAGVRTVTLFFEKGASTHHIWYYELNPGRNLGKTNPLNDDDLEEFLELQKTFADSDNSWTVPIDDIDKETWDLSPTNPNVEDTSEKRTPSEILAEIEALDNETAEAMAAIKELL